MIEIPKLIFGDPASKKSIAELGKKLKLARLTWIATKLSTPGVCDICRHDISDESRMTSGTHQAHTRCLEDLKDLALRCGQGGA